jgi:hypothetical protein
MNSNALALKSAVVRHAVYDLKHVLVTVEPCFQSHDVWSMSKARRQYEWEIKQSIADLRREASKYKHKNGGLIGHALVDWQRENLPNYFNFVVPKDISEKAGTWIAEHMPFAGLIAFDGVFITVLRKAQLLHASRAPVRRCARVARWMAVTVADLMRYRAQTPAI